MLPKQGVGCTLLETNNKRVVEQRGKGSTNKCVHTKSSPISHRLFSKNKATQINSHTNRQHDSSNVTFKNGRNKKSGTEFNSQTNLGLIYSKRDHTAEYLTTSQNIIVDLELHHYKDSSEWKLLPETFKKDCQKLGHPRVDLFA